MLGEILSDHGDWSVAQLKTSYRIPSEIMEFVSPLALAIAPTLSYPQSIRDAGTDAVRTVATEPWRFLDDVITQVGRLVDTSDGSTPRSVTVIVPDDSDWPEAISGKINEGDGFVAQQREAVSVLTAAQAKGMEYDHVLVIEPAAIADRGPAGLRQLYVALTRSTQSLTLLHTAPLPAALTASTDGPEPVAPDTQPPGSAESLPRIGSDIRVKVIGHVSGGRYKVKPLVPMIDRQLVLTVRPGSVPPRRGDELDCWVFANEMIQTVLTADRRGRSPVSERMAGRYLAALDVLAELTSSSDVPDARSRLSELQGMANRVLRRDQADWVDVLHLFGDPDRRQLGVLRDLSAATNRALKEGAFDADQLATELNASGWVGPLAEARRKLLERFDTRTEQEPSGVVPTAATQPKQKEEVQMTTAETTVATSAATARDSLLRALEAAADADRTCKKHEAVRHALKAALLWADLQPTDSSVVDVSCVTSHGLFLYEALGAGRTTYEDLRSGATRLLEINHTLPTPADGLYLALAEPPAEDWSVDAIRGVFHVNVIWHSPAGWVGEDPNAVLGASG
jgi:hypothetical protein